MSRGDFLGYIVGRIFTLLIARSNYNILPKFEANWLGFTREGLTKFDLDLGILVWRGLDLILGARMNLIFINCIRKD